MRTILLNDDDLITAGDTYLSATTDGKWTPIPAVWVGSPLRAYTNYMFTQNAIKSGMSDVLIQNILSYGITDVGIARHKQPTWIDKIFNILGIDTLLAKW